MKSSCRRTKRSIACAGHGVVSSRAPTACTRSSTCARCRPAGNQVLTPHLETVALGPVLRLVLQGYVEDLKRAPDPVELDSGINRHASPACRSELLKKALDNISSTRSNLPPMAVPSSSMRAPVRLMAWESSARSASAIPASGLTLPITRSSSKNSISWGKWNCILPAAPVQRRRTRSRTGDRGGHRQSSPGENLGRKSGKNDGGKMPGSTFVIQVPLAK